MTTADLTPLAVLAAVHLLAAMSPGATFLVISRQALSSGRASAAMGALACGLGALPWAIAAVLGLALVLEQAQWLYGLMKLLGGLYLLYLATLVWRHAASPIALPEAGATARPLPAFREAFLTQIANPKVAGFFASIFVTVLPMNPPAWLIAAILINVFLVEAVWYLCVAVFFASARPRAFYIRAKPAIDRIMAGLLAIFGVKLLADARGA
jgi:threonine/homoserine/homoserine lactone efflux protein